MQRASLLIPSPFLLFMVDTFLLAEQHKAISPKDVCLIAIYLSLALASLISLRKIASLIGIFARGVGMLSRSLSRAAEGRWYYNDGELVQSINSTERIDVVFENHTVYNLELTW